MAIACALALATVGAAAQPLAPPPTELNDLRLVRDFFPGTTYRSSVPTVQSLLGFPAAAHAATAAEIEKCLKAWAAAAPDRTRLVEYARTYEQRPLYYMIVTAPTNLARLDAIQAGLDKLGDPRTTTAAEADELIATLPAVGWLGYTIHGDETEGSDAALVVLYHLIAAEDAAVRQLLEEVVVIVDPLMNPDGRDRFVKMIAEHRGAHPNVDDQSLVHDGYWPYGRGNHYLFDLNRDSLWCAHPETRGRIRAMTRWHPQLVVDAHGMGSQETHLFSPPREPINPNIPAGRARWAEVFARDQAQAFDRHQLLYYTGEWHEEWYPGYTDGWASYRGAIGILYEQARVAEDGVRRPEGRILSYSESVQHHVVGSLANLATLKNHGRDLRRNLYETRRAALAADGPYARRTFAVAPTPNRSRLKDFAALLEIQGIELFVATTNLAVPQATDQLGRAYTNLTLAAGTLLIPNRQPLGHLLAAMLEFDPRFSPAVLADERTELLRKGRSRVYDVTAWNLTMMYGLEAHTLSGALPEAVRPYAAPPADPRGVLREPTVTTAYVIDGADDLSVTAAARLMERGLQVCVAEKPFRFEETDFARGSVLVTALDNRHFAGDLRQTVRHTVEELGLSGIAIGAGLGAGDLPDLGGSHFQRLERPRIGVFGREGVSSTDFGAIWYVLDQYLGIRHAHLDNSGRLDLDRYNVLVVPEGRGASLAANLKDWVKAGGTLVAIGSSANAFTTEKALFSRVRPLPEVLGRLADYELAIFREWLGHTKAVPPAETVWTHKAMPNVVYPWQAVDGPHPDEKELKKRDAWQNLFMPQGALLASRVDTNHWLTVGCGELLPTLVSRQPVLMAAEGVDAPIRYGYLTPTFVVTNAAGSPSAPPPQTEPGRPADKKEPDKKDKKEPPRIGWCALPEGTELHLRMSGLLWPEASHRVANAAWVTRESFGRGQIILFATPPTFRAAARGATRVFLNAITYGPGFGTPHPVRP